MRISDWSSDVCSSDLSSKMPNRRFVPKRAAIADIAEHAQKVDALLKSKIRAFVEAHNAPNGHFFQGGDFFGSDDDDSDAEDRKRDVKGKSESVRVDLGGRRIIKKNKH